jgi:hypothetical protein
MEKWGAYSPIDTDAEEVWRGMACLFKEYF